MHGFTNLDFAQNQQLVKRSFLEEGTIVGRAQHHHYEAVLSYDGESFTLSWGRGPGCTAIELSNRIQGFFLALAIARDRNLLRPRSKSKIMIKSKT